jgi:cytochrome c biogenesis protein CcdA
VCDRVVAQHCNRVDMLLLIQLGGLLIVLLGLQMLGVLRLAWLARTYLHVDPERFAARGGLAGAFLVGAAFASAGHPASACSWAACWR